MKRVYCSVFFLLAVAGCRISESDISKNTSINSVYDHAVKNHKIINDTSYRYLSKCNKFNFCSMDFNVVHADSIESLSKNYYIMYNNSKNDKFFKVSYLSDDIFNVDYFIYKSNCFNLIYMVDFQDDKLRVKEGEVVNGFIFGGNKIGTYYFLGEGGDNTNPMSINKYSYVKVIMSLDWDLYPISQIQLENCYIKRIGSMFYSIDSLGSKNIKYLLSKSVVGKKRLNGNNSFKYIDGVINSNNMNLNNVEKIYPRMNKNYPYLPLWLWGGDIGYR